MDYLRSLLAHNPIQVRRNPEPERQGARCDADRLRRESMQRHHAEKVHTGERRSDCEYLLGRERKGRRSTVQIAKIEPRWIDTQVKTRYLVVIYDNETLKPLEKKWRSYRRAVRMLQI